MVACVPSPDDSQHIVKRFKWCMDDAFCFAVAAKSPLGKDMIRGSRETEVRPAIADQDRGESSASVDRARDGALAQAAADSAFGVAMRKPKVQAAAAESEPVRVDGNRKRELPQGVADRIVEPVADDGKISKRPNVVDEVDEGRIDGHRLQELQ